MVSRHTVAAGHAAAITTPSSSSSNSSTSSIKPTGWIRASSASRPVLGDRTNLASSSRSTPLQSLSKPSVVQGGARRSTPATSGKVDRQRKLSSFFAPNTAPPAAEKVAQIRSGVYEDSPSLIRVRSRSAQGDKDAESTAAVGLEDDELEARAAQLLRGRFGSVTRSLTPTRSNTPTRLPSPPRNGPDPESPHVQRPSAFRRVMPPPSPVHHQRPTKSPSASKKDRTTPPRPPPPASASSPPFEPTLTQESLSNFTPLPWEKAHASRAALFQRLAGKSKEQVLEKQKSHMADEVAKAHARMQVRSPTAPQQRGAMNGRKATTSQGEKGRMKHAAALAGSPPRKGRPEAVLRSPRSNRRIYALETQVGGNAVLGGRAVSLQPIRMDGEGDANAQRRALSEVRPGFVPFASRQDLSPEVHRTPAEESEGESETLPLAWPADDDRPESDVEAEAAIDLLDQTQPLSWDDEENQQQHPDVVPQQESLAEVPPSDDEDLLLQTVIPSSSSSSSPSSPSASPSRLRLRRPRSHDQPSPTHKRQRVGKQHLSPRPSHASQSRTPLQQRCVPKFSPITLTSSFGGSAGGGENNRFDRVVGALKREERRRNSGMQLNLNAYLSTPSGAGAEEVEQRREGLGEDLQDVLSDDEDGDGDTTITRRRSEDAGEVETQETQPLAWPDSPERLHRPQLRPLQDSSPVPATQRSGASVASTTSSSSGRISLPSESNLDEAGNTQLRSFFRDL